MFGIARRRGGLSAARGRSAAGLRLLLPVAALLVAAALAVPGVAQAAPPTLGAIVLSLLYGDARAEQGQSVPAPEPELAQS